MSNDLKHALKAKTFRGLRPAAPAAAPLTMADGGMPMRRPSDPVVGTRGPVSASMNSGLSAPMRPAATALQPTPVPAPSATPAANQLSLRSAVFDNQMRSVVDERRQNMAMAELADGGQPDLRTMPMGAGLRHMYGMADGGSHEGLVKGAGTGVSDSVPARYSHGEYVLPADTTAALGIGNLDAIKDATHTPAAVQRGLRMADGGAGDLTAFRGSRAPLTTNQLYAYQDQQDALPPPAPTASQTRLADAYGRMNKEATAGNIPNNADTWAAKVAQNSQAGQTPTPAEPSSGAPYEFHGLDATRANFESSNEGLRNAKGFGQTLGATAAGAAKISGGLILDAGRALVTNPLSAMAGMGKNALIGAGLMNGQSGGTAPNPATTNGAPQTTDGSTFSQMDSNLPPTDARLAGLKRFGAVSDMQQRTAQDTTGMGLRNNKTVDAGGVDGAFGQQAANVGAGNQNLRSSLRGMANGQAYQVNDNFEGRANPDKIYAQKDAKGQLVLSGVGNGQANSEYMNSDQYREGVARANNDKAQLTQLQDSRKEQDLKDNLSSSSITGLRANKTALNQFYANRDLDKTLGKDREVAGLRLRAEQFNKDREYGIQQRTQARADQTLDFNEGNTADEKLADQLKQRYMTGKDDKGAPQLDVSGHSSALAGMKRSMAALGVKDGRGLDGVDRERLMAGAQLSDIVNKEGSNILPWKPNFTGTVLPHDLIGMKRVGDDYVIQHGSAKGNAIPARFLNKVNADYFGGQKTNAFDVLKGN